MTTCDRCGNECKPTRPGIGTGYGISENGRKHCYKCCGEIDLEKMKSEGSAVLYLESHAERWRIVNWPASLAFPVAARKESRHNIAGIRRDVWFKGPDSFIWHGTQYGEDNQLCRVKRTKRKNL